MNRFMEFRFRLGSHLTLAFARLVMPRSLNDLFIKCLARGAAELTAEAREAMRKGDDS